MQHFLNRNVVMLRSVTFGETEMTWSGRRCSGFADWHWKRVVMGCSRLELRREGRPAEIRRIGMVPVFVIAVRVEMDVQEFMVDQVFAPWRFAAGMSTAEMEEEMIVMVVVIGIVRQEVQQGVRKIQNVCHVEPSWQYQEQGVDFVQESLILDAMFLEGVILVMFRQRLVGMRDQGIRMESVRIVMVISIGIGKTVSSRCWRSRVEP